MLYLGNHLISYFLSTFLFISGFNFSELSSLKKVFDSKFKVGVAINKNQIKQKKSKEVDLIKNQFSSLTAENVMKWEEIHPKKNKYNFKISDLIVSMAQENYHRKLYIIAKNF